MNFASQQCGSAPDPDARPSASQIHEVQNAFSRLVVRSRDTQQTSSALGRGLFEFVEAVAYCVAAPVFGRRPPALRPSSSQVLHNYVFI